MNRAAALKLLHAELDACRACPNVIGPVVHGPPVVSRIVLIGQAPGRHEGDLGRPFAWTAGKTLFKWFESTIGCTEAQFRATVYMTAVARCFPGKAAGGGDRKPAPDEIERCGRFLSREVQILAPRLLIPVGALAIEQVLGRDGQLASVVGEARRAHWHGVEADIIALPHPSGASTWHRREPGKTLLQRALALIAAHPEVKQAFALV
jgi:uracil-DNA glycosylase